MQFWQNQALPKTDPSKSPLPGEWLFYLITLVGSLISLLFWHASLIQSNFNLTHTTQIEAQHLTNDITTQLTQRIILMEQLGKHLSEEEQTSYVHWRNNVGEFVSDYGDFQAIGLFDPNLHLTWSLPADANTRQLYALFIKRYSKNIQKVATQPWLSSTFDIAPTTKGLLIVVPIEMHGSIKNYLIGIVNITKILTASISPDNYFFTIYAGKQIIYSTSTLVTLSNLTVQKININLYGNNWQLYIQPTPELITSLRNSMPAVALILGICVSILFLTVIRLAQLSRERAKSLDKINNDLKNEIVDHMAAEAAKQKLERALLQGQKLQAIGTMAGGIAHDFNNLLYAIIGYVEMGQEDVPKNTVIHKNLGKALEACRRGQELIARILAFSRRQHHAFKRVAIKPTIENIMALLIPTVPAGVKIDFITDIPENFTLLGDPTRLHQIIINIVNNAVDAMDDEGNIVIKLSVIKAGDELLTQFPDVVSGNYCRIDISDQGHGMDQNTVERIFEPFFTTKEVGKGTGLGLATVHTIVKEHRGEILVISQLGQGTCFTILLPEYNLTKATKENDHG